MKQKLLGFFLCILSIQVGTAQLKFGIKMGVTATDVNMNAVTSLNDLELPTARSLNYDGGIVLEYEFMHNLLSIRSGLDFIQKGFNVNLDQAKEKYEDLKEISGDWKANFQYLQIPVNIVYHIGKFNINAGPYLAYGLGGEEIQDLKMVFTDGTIQNVQQDIDLEAVFGDVEENLSDIDLDTGMLIQYFNGLDYGINVGAGFSINKLTFNVQYQQGLSNITPELANDPDFNPSDLLAKHNVFSFEIIYFFKKP